jgi:hypothetical protein
VLVLVLTGPQGAGDRTEPPKEHRADGCRPDASCAVKEPAGKWFHPVSIFRYCPDA